MAKWKAVMECPRQEVEGGCDGAGQVVFACWSFPATYNDPPDNGVELASQSCACDLTDEEMAELEDKAYNARGDQ